MIDLFEALNDEPILLHAAGRSTAGTCPRLIDTRGLE